MPFGVEQHAARFSSCIGTLTWSVGDQPAADEGPDGYLHGLKCIRVLGLGPAAAGEVGVAGIQGRACRVSYACCNSAAATALPTPPPHRRRRWQRWRSCCTANSRENVKPQSHLGDLVVARVRAQLALNCACAPGVVSSV